VTLAGTVPNDAARYKAYKIANETAGGTKNKDQKTVAPAPGLGLNPPAHNPEPSSTALNTGSPARAANKVRKARTKNSPAPTDDSQLAENTPAPQQEPPPETPVSSNVQEQPVSPASPQPELPPTPTPP